MEIIGNSVTNNNMDGYGGGIYVGYSTYTDVGTVTLPADAKIYNNHALTAGDDIYVASGNGTVPSLTFGEVGSNWVLNDCEHFIDGWYQDGSGNRWVGHAETPEENNMELFPVEGSTTVTGLTALKAAHGEDYQKKTSLPGLEKKVETTNEEGETVWGDATSANANDKVNFQLTSNVPEDLLNYLMPEDAEDPKVDTPQNAALLAGDPLEGRGSYVLTFHDVMDGHLAFDANSVSVTIGSKPLDDEYYTVHVPGATHGEGEDAETCTFEITLDLVDLYNRGLITDEDISAATPITVTYTATLDKDVTAGEYLNTAWVSYPTDETEKDTVTVDTYDINIFKYDQSTSEGLNGAQFELYGAGAYTKDEEGNWTKVDGAEPIRTGIISGQDGYVTINGLAEGTYYLVETQAPEGYVASEKPLEIVIPEKADTENVVHVQFANSPIPHTGGMGTTMYTVGGTAILALGGALFVLNRKKLQQA